MNPILLLHGALGSDSQLERIKTQLIKNGHTVHSLNFSGHGGVSFSSNGFGIDIFATDVLHFLKTNNISKVDIFGYSMGGYVALWLAHLHPEYVGTIVTLGTKFDWSVESATKEVKKLNPDKIAEKVPAFARILQHRHAPNDWKELLHKTAEMMMQLGNKPLLSEDIIQTIRTPTLICLGDKDDMADRDYSGRVAQLLPNGKFKLLENTAHPIEGVAYVPFMPEDK